VIVRFRFEDETVDANVTPEFLSRLQALLDRERLSTEFLFRLVQQIQYVDENLTRLQAEHQGRFVLIAGREEVFVGDTWADALTYARQELSDRPYFAVHFAAAQASAAPDDSLAHPLAYGSA
jgi:hypothetical protein